jgi:serine/threonine protein phosphatase 1
MTARTIALGEIHGCSLALGAILDVIRPRTLDTIVTLGDYINRGPHSRGVIDRLIDLGRRCRLVPLLGNHEQTLLDVRAGRAPVSWFLDMGGGYTLDSYGSGRDISVFSDEHFRFLEACLDFHETDSHIFVHASYVPDLAIPEQPTNFLRWESLRNSLPEPHVSGKTVIAGHTSQKGGEVLDVGHRKVIDTYCYGGGWLTAMDVITGEVWQADREGTGIRRR